MAGHTHSKAAGMLEARKTCLQDESMNKTIYSKQSECLRSTLVRLRQEAGLTQRDLAARLNREHGLVGRLELGERRLDLIEFFWLCKACDSNPEKVTRELLRQFEKIQTDEEGRQ